MDWPLNICGPMPRHGPIEAFLFYNSWSFCLVVCLHSNFWTHQKILQIFTKFYQTGAVAHHSSSQINFKGGGPGLGLAIVKNLAEAMGGLVGVEPREPTGSCFWVIVNKA